MSGIEQLKIANPFHSEKLLLHSERIASLASGEIPPPQTIEVDLADGFCNQSCVHCCFDSSTVQQLIQIDREVLGRALTSAYEMGTRAVELVGGGEPTTHAEVAGIIEDISEIGAGDMQVGVITNGVMAERLLPVADRLTFVRISLDTADPDTYTAMHRAPKFHHQKVLTNIQRLRDAIPQNPVERKLGIGYLVVPPYNHQAEQIRLGAELANELGADYIAYRPAELDDTIPRSEWHEARTAIAAARLALRNSGSQTAVFGGSGVRWETMEPGAHPTGACHAKPIVAVIQANGDIAHCILYRNKRKMRIGNIHEDTFTALWLSDRHKNNWQSFQVDGCPNPCKVYAYNNIVGAVIAGDPGVPPSRDEVAHHNFV